VERKLQTLYGRICAMYNDAGIDDEMGFEQNVHLQPFTVGLNVYLQHNYMKAELSIGIRNNHHCR
jgi:hypothetical protein